MFVTFSDCKESNATTPSHKECEVQTRTVIRKSSIGGLYICAGGLDILKNW